MLINALGYAFQNIHTYKMELIITSDITTFFFSIKHLACLLSDLTLKSLRGSSFYAIRIMPKVHKIFWKFLTHSKSTKPSSIV